MISFIAAALLCAAPTAAPAAQPATDHVVLIVLDAWGSYSWEKCDMPTTKALAANGAYTLRARCVLPTVSAPNWNSIFTGVEPAQHGYISNTKAPSFFPTTVNEHGFFPTIFSELRRQRPDSEIGVVHEWGDVKHFVDSLSVDYMAQGITDFDRNTTAAGRGTRHPALTQLAADYIRARRPRLLLVGYDQPDHVGHTAGHDTPAYYDVMHRLDALIAQIVQATKDAGIYERTTFIITADHGGIVKGHGGYTDQELYTPFIMSGKGVRRVGEFKQAFMRYDVAATVARLLGIEAPQVWTGRAATWAIAE